MNFMPICSINFILSLRDVVTCDAGNVNLITLMMYDFYKKLYIESLIFHMAGNNLGYYF